MAGRSVHNTRIERLWRDLYEGVLGMYYQTFMHLEDDGLLDPCDDIDLYSLHYTFLPFTNRVIVSFREMWNHRKLRTEQNNSPLQLLISGMQNIATDDSVVANEYFEQFKKHNINRLV